MEKIIAKASVAKTSQIKEMVSNLASDFSSEATIVTNSLLSILEARMSEDEFVSFCEELEAA